MINKNTINNMKSQIKVSDALIEKTKNNISTKHNKNPFKPFITLTTVGMMLVIMLLTIIGFNNNDEGKPFLSLNPLEISVYATEDSNYYLTANYQNETSKQTLKSNIEVKLAKYNKAMSSVPGIPISFHFNNQDDIDFIKINISSGEILNWNIETGVVTNLENDYKLTNNETLYFSPDNNTIISLVGIKGNKEIFTRNIKVTVDNEYNYYAIIEDYQYN